MASKRFEIYRQRVGVHKTAPDQRIALATFHSFRKFFATAADRAGVTNFSIRQVIGHAAQGVTKSVYTDDNPIEWLRRCVDAGRLPAGVMVVPSAEAPMQARVVGEGGLSSSSGLVTTT